MADLAELGYTIRTEPIERANRGLDGMANSSDRAAGSMTGMERTVMRAAASLAAMVVSVQALRGGISTLAGYGQEMSTVQAITQATSAEFRALSAEAQRLGSTTRFSASEAAQGMAFLARAGFSAEEALAATEGTLTLAQSGALGLGQAADIASNVLTGFRLEVDQTARVVDVLSFTANNANTTVGQLGEAMSMVAPVAAGLGVSVEESAAAIAALSDAGIQSTRAGTGLRRVLSTLESPTAAAEAILSDLGLTTNDVRVSSVGLTAALQALAGAGIDTGTALELFGDRGGPAFEVLSSSIPTVISMNSELQNAEGTAQRIATTMDSNLNGALLAVRSAAEAVTLSFGALSGTGMEDTALGVASSLRLVAENADIVARGISVGVVGFAAYRVALIATTADVTRFTAVMGGMTTSMGRAIVATRALAAAKALLLGPLGIAVLAATSAGIAFTMMGNSQAEQARRAERAAEEQERLNNALEAARELIGGREVTFGTEADQSFAEGIQILQRYQDELEGISVAAREAQTQAGIAAREQVDQQRTALQEVEDQLALLRRALELGVARSTRSQAEEEIRGLNEQARLLSQGLAAAEAALARVFSTPTSDFDPEAESRARAYTEAERSLDRQLQLARMRTDAERMVAAALWDAGLALDSQGDEAENIRRLALEIYRVTEQRAAAEERIQEAQALAERQRQSLADARERLQLVEIEDETRRSIAEAMLRAGFAMDDQSDAAIELRGILTEIAGIEERRATAARAAADAVRAQQQAAANVEKLRTELAVADGPLATLQNEYEQRLELIRSAQENELALIEQGVLREGELMEMRNALQRQYDEERTSIMLQSASAGFGSLAEIMRASVGEQSAAYQAMFALSKGFAIAESVIAIQQAIAKAMAVGFPANIPLMAMAAAQGASIIQTIQAAEPGFMSGGYTGNGPVGAVAGVVHGQEGVLHAGAMRGIGVQALDYMNRNRALPPSNDNGGKQTVLQFDMRGAIITEELLQDINSKISESENRSIATSVKISARNTQTVVGNLARPRLSAGGN